MCAAATGHSPSVVPRRASVEGASSWWRGVTRMGRPPHDNVRTMNCHGTGGYTSNLIRNLKIYSVIVLIYRETTEPLELDKISLEDQTW